MYTGGLLNLLVGFLGSSGKFFQAFLGGSQECPLGYPGGFFMEGCLGGFRGPGGSSRAPLGLPRGSGAGIL